MALRITSHNMRALVDSTQPVDQRYEALVESTRAEPEAPSSPRREGCRPDGRKLAAVPSDTEEIPLQAVAGDDTVKMHLTQHLADVDPDRLGDPKVALLVLLEALEIDPANEKLLGKVLKLHQKNQQWREAVEVAIRMAELNRDPIGRGHCYHAAATALEKIESFDAALTFFNLALDEYFSVAEPMASRQQQMTAFEAIDRICTMRGDWTEKERNFLRMVERMPMRPT